MSKYSLIPFTPESLANAKRAWEAIVGIDAFDVEFAPFFEWAEGHIDPKEHDSRAFDLSNNDVEGRTDAIVEVVDSRKGALSKLLRIIPSPQFCDVTNSRAELVQLYTETFFQVIVAGGLHGQQRKVKLYGRDDDMMSLLRSIHSHWAVPDSSADFEGRFLAITLSQPGASHA
jgi:hypothetical protein